MLAFLVFKQHRFKKKIYIYIHVSICVVYHLLFSDNFKPNVL